MQLPQDIAGDASEILAVTWSKPGRNESAAYRSSFFGPSNVEWKLLLARPVHDGYYCWGIRKSSVQEHNAAAIASHALSLEAL